MPLLPAAYFQACLKDKPTIRAKAMKAVSRLKSSHFAEHTDLEFIRLFFMHPGSSVRLYPSLLSVLSFLSPFLSQLSSLVEVDPSILSLDTVRSAVEDRFLDASVSVREAAIDLVGKHVLTSPQVALKVRTSPAFVQAVDGNHQ